MSTAAANAPMPTPAQGGQRVLVLHEPGPAGAAALDIARELDLQQRAVVTVVAVAPKAPSGSRCGGSAREFNSVVREAVEEELDGARQRLGHGAGRADYMLLVEGEDPPLEEWVAARAFDLVLLPARRRLLRGPGHPVAARLRAMNGPEIRVVQRRTS